MTAELFGRYFAALSDGDTDSAVALARAQQDSGVPIVDILEGLVSPGQHEVGRRWARNDWGVASEHRATSVSEEVVAALVAHLRPWAEPAGTVVVTCADGEWHSLPSRILAAVLSEAGWTVMLLGASVSTRHVSHLLHEVGPDLTALSCSIPTSLFHARQVIEASRAAGVPVLVGGRGFGGGGRWAGPLGADAWAPDARAALELLAGRGVPAFTDPAPPLEEPDDDSRRLLASRAGIVAGCMSRATARMGEVARYDSYQLARTEEDFGFIVDFLRTALLVDDEMLFVEFVGWLIEILRARSVPPGTVRAGLRVVSDVLAELVGELPRTQRILRAGLDSTDRSGGSTSAL